jgi:hypothetical protein
VGLLGGAEYFAARRYREWFWGCAFMQLWTGHAVAAVTDGPYGPELGDAAGEGSPFLAQLCAAVHALAARRGQ